VSGSPRVTEMSGYLPSRRSITSLKTPIFSITTVRTLNLACNFHFRVVLCSSH
jgi:hypothetical protein